MSRLCPIPSVALPHAGKRRAAFALVHHYVRLPFVAPLAKSMPIWLETQDVQAVLHVQQGLVNLISGKPDPFPAMLADEMRWVRTADAVVAISESELPTFRAHVGADKVFLCQPPITVRPPPPGAAAVPPRDILLVASVNPGNFASLKWFLAQVWPAVRKAGLNCTVVGNINWMHTARGNRSARCAVCRHGRTSGAVVRQCARRRASDGRGHRDRHQDRRGVGRGRADRGDDACLSRPAVGLAEACPSDRRRRGVRRRADPAVRQCACPPGNCGARVREAYTALDLENRFHRQMQAIETHVLAAGKARFGERRGA